MLWLGRLVSDRVVYLEELLSIPTVRTVSPASGSEMCEKLFWYGARVI